MSTNEPRVESDRVAALAAIYQAERQDGSNLVNARLALIAMQLTYIGVASVLLNHDTLADAAWVAAFLAAPLWFLHAYHVQLVALTTARGRSTEIVEARLVAASGLPDSLQANVGARAGYRMTNIHEQHTVLKIQSLISYGGIGAVIVIFAGYCLKVSSDAAGWISLPVFLGAVAYVGFLVAAVGAWFHIGRDPQWTDPGPS